VEEKIKAAYLADLNFFHSEAEENPDLDCSVPIAYLNIKLGEYADAITAAEEGLKRNQFCTHLQVLLAEAYMHLGRRDEAREILFDAVISDDDNYKAYKLLGVIFKSETDEENAIKYLRAAYMKAPEDTELITWLEDMGGLTDFSNKSKDAEDEDEDAFDYDADEPKFETQALLTGAETALTELSNEINNYKQQGKTVDHMISDHAVIAKETAQKKAAESAEAIGKEIDTAQDLSNEEILKALADANISPESETSKNQTQQPQDYSDILAGIAAQEAEEAAQDLSVPQAVSEGGIPGIPAFTIPKSFRPTADEEAPGPNADEPKPDETADFLTKAAENFAQEETGETITEEATTEETAGIETEGIETETAAQTVESKADDTETLDFLTKAAENFPDEEEPAEQGIIDTERDEARQDIGLGFVPPDMLPAIPESPVDPTAPPDFSEAQETAETEDGLASALNAMNLPDKETAGLSDISDISDTSDISDISEDDTEELPDNLTAISEPIASEEVNVLETLPEDLADEDEPEDNENPDDYTYPEEKTVNSDAAPFIPENLLDAVFKEGGMDLGEKFTEDSEKIDILVQEKQQ
jgi:hypothetical protein